MAIIRKQNKFFLEQFYPKVELKYLGKVTTFQDTRIFCTHIKKPDIHFYIKQQGYPVNEELLQMLKNAQIHYILIPENGKTGFRLYITEVKNYLYNGIQIKEKHVEQQRIFPLKEMRKIEVNESQKEKILTIIT